MTAWRMRGSEGRKEGAWLRFRLDNEGERRRDGVRFNEVVTGKRVFILFFKCV